MIIPEVPGFAGDIAETTSIKTILAAQWRTINRGGHSICEEISKSGFDPLGLFSMHIHGCSLFLLQRGLYTVLPFKGL